MRPRSSLSSLLWSTGLLLALTACTRTAPPVQRSVTEEPDPLQQDRSEQLAAQRDLPVLPAGEERSVSASSTKNVEWTDPQGLKASIRNDGMLLSPTGEGEAPWSVSIMLHRIGRSDDRFLPVTTPEVERSEQRTLARHGPFDVEHVNTAEGIRQNFILHERLHGTGPVELFLSVAGGLHPTDDGQNSISFTNARSVKVLRYSELCVWDAHGDTLPAQMTLSGDTIRITVDDALAHYPVTVDPLVTTPVWTMDGGQSNSEFGWSVASAGDVNGDGYSDIIVGHHLYDNGQTNEGRVVVYHGSASGPSTTPSWTYESNSASAQFGYCVSTAGDVNGDGYSDVIVGAPYLDNGQTDEGRVYVFHGSSSGLSATPNWTYERDQATSYLGRSVACAGDVNGDGYSDIIFGAPFFDSGNTNEGRVFVFHGSATGLPSSVTWLTEGNQDGANAGASVACAGDVNGDGYSDIIYGAPLYDNGQADEGRAVVHLGSATGLLTAAHWTAESDQASANAGTSVSSAGDVDNDGYSDVVVGTPLWDGGQTDEGRIQIARGSASGLTIVHQTLEPDFAGEQRGSSVACAGDVNGDGYADVLSGSPLHSSGGEVDLFLGMSTGISAVPTSLSGFQANARFGRSVASAGDFNGDGFSDVIVGAQFHDGTLTNEGRVRCYPGAAASISNTADRVLPGPVGSSAYGRTVSSAGDVNGDGYSDVIIGAPGGNRAYVHYGSAAGTSLVPDRTYIQMAIAGFGYCVSGAGDVNGDGFSDVIIGAEQGGAVHVYHGSSAGLSAAPNWTVSGTVNTRFGFSVSCAGDVNADGYADVIIGHPGYNTGAGRAMVYHGSPTGLSATPDWISAPFDAPHLPNSNYGEGVDGAGDVNGDGYSDVIIGAGGFNSERGRVVIFHGGPGGLPALPASIFNHTLVGQRFGSNPHSGACASGVGDVNGDGYSDVIMARMGFQAYIHHGGPAGVSIAPSWSSFLGGGGFYGATVASAGDLNADGYSDVVVSECAVGARIYFGGQWGLGGPIFGAPTNLPDLTIFGSGSHSAAGAGDVNGDGYSDLLIGQYTSNIAVVHFGNTSADLTRGHFRLYETDLTTPITAANIPIPQFGAGLFARPFLGRTRTKLVWETRIQGAAFSTGSNGLVNNSTARTAQQATFNPGAVAGVELKNLIDKPGGGTGITATKVRARVRFDLATAITGQVFGPWRYMPGYLDGLGTHNNVPLPVELLWFDATCSNGTVQLAWTTASEENSSHFVVQRSADGSHWTDIGQVTAAGHSHQQVDYAHHDPAPTPAAVLYYRLLQFDLDGQSTTLPTASVTCISNTIRVFPNPTEDLIRVDATAMGNEVVQYTVIDDQGRMVRSGSLSIAEAPTPISLASLPTGAYTLLLLNDGGEVLAAERVIKR